MPPCLTRSRLSLGLAAGCIAALALPTSVPAAGDPDGEVAQLRAQGPAALDRLLVRWDQTRPGVEREDLALTIDRVAAQRYATTSRLYWYTDLPAAKAAARTQHRPILALRMLGRLDEDLSCTNSRLFRTTLYANTRVSAFLRDHFILFWSSERPVPRVTIDLGGGRKVESTVTGNSAHYVLDETGAVLDVLPGLYAPIAFTTELTHSLALANRVRSLDDNSRRAAIVAYHQRAANETSRAWEAMGNTPYLPAARRLTSGSAADSAVALAQRATVSKAYIEVPVLRRIAIGTTAGDISADDIALWAAVGQRAWNITTAPDPRPTPKKRPTAAPLPVLDDASRALIARLHNAVPADLIAGPEALAVVIERLEQHVVADSAKNQFQLRPQIHVYLQDMHGTDVTFEALNAWIYASVFHTPSTDAWLGLVPRTDFTGLPGDGLLAPRS